MMEKLKLFELMWSAPKTAAHNHVGNKFRV